jgi:hypothetical protein
MVLSDIPRMTQGSVERCTNSVSLLKTLNAEKLQDFLGFRSFEQGQDALASASPASTALNERAMMAPRLTATVWWPLIASSATLALNSAENRLRVLMVDRPLPRQIHLNRLSQETGPPLNKVKKIMPGERNLVTGLLSKDANSRLVVSGPIGVKEMERLIQKLELDKEILADPDPEKDEAAN